MTDPHSTLSIFAEVSVAIAGFSGIVIAFGHRSASAFSKLEIRRLSNLFTLSGLALTISLTGVALLHLNLPDPSVLWRWGSAIVFVLAAPWLAWDLAKVSRLEKAEKAGVNSFVLLTFNTLAFAMLILQLINSILIMESWPFFLALVLIIVGAFQQFILLVRMELPNNDNRRT